MYGIVWVWYVIVWCCVVFELSRIHVFHVQLQKYYDSEGQFDISEPLCITLNNLTEANLQLHV